METKPYRRKAQYYETDQMGIIHHANYIHWFEEARVDFMQQIGYGYEKAVQTGIDFALNGVGCEYHSMVRFGDEVDIVSTITKLTPSRMTVTYRVLDAASGELRASGHTNHFYFDNNKKRPVALKKAMPELYQLLAGFCTGA